MNSIRHGSRVAGALALALSFAACDSLITEGVTSRDDVPMTSFIKAGAVSQNAATGSNVEIFARIGDDVDDAKKTITFVTSAGWWVENATKTITVRAVPDLQNPGKLIARTSLRDTLPDVAIVRAAIGDVYDTVSVTFKKP